MMIWNWPNILTWLRILAIPLIMLLFLLGEHALDNLADPIAGLLFAAAAITELPWMMEPVCVSSNSRLCMSPPLTSAASAEDAPWASPRMVAGPRLEISLEKRR